VAPRLPTGVDPRGIEAAMLYFPNAPSILAPGSTSLFIERLSSAPWNRGGRPNPPKLRGTGRALIEFAVLESRSRGHAGRLTLQSVPDPRTLQFYLNLGFTDTQERDGDLSNLELSPESGRKHI